MLVKQLLYTEKYTIDGARQKVDEHRKGGELKSVARAALNMQTLECARARPQGAGRLLAPDEHRDSPSRARHLPPELLIPRCAS